MSGQLPPPPPPVGDEVDEYDDDVEDGLDDEWDDDTVEDGAEEARRVAVVRVLAYLAGAAAVVVWVLTAFQAKRAVEDVDSRWGASAPQISQLVDEAMLGLTQWVAAAMALTVAATVLAVLARD